jgi:antitoxin MazE
MKIGRRGNDLAIRIPAAIVKELDLKSGEEMQITVTGEHQFEVSRDRRRLEALEAIRKLRRPLPPGYKFNREEIHERQWMRSINIKPTQMPSS